MKLTISKLESILGVSDITAVKEVSLEGQQIQDVGSLAGCLSLKNLHLAGNRFTVKRQLEGIFLVPYLEKLDLSGAPVTRSPKYREYVISHCPETLTHLDNKKVRPEERANAELTFPGARARLKGVKGDSSSKQSAGGVADIFSNTLKKKKKSKAGSADGLFGDSFIMPSAKPAHAAHSSLGALGDSNDSSETQSKRSSRDSGGIVGGLNLAPKKSAHKDVGASVFGGEDELFSSISTGALKRQRTLSSKKNLAKSVDGKRSPKADVPAQAAVKKPLSSSLFEAPVFAEEKDEKEPEEVMEEKAAVKEVATTDSLPDPDDLFASVSSKPKAKKGLFDDGDDLFGSAKPRTAKGSKKEAAAIDFSSDLPATRQASAGMDELFGSSSKVKAPKASLFGEAEPAPAPRDAEVEESHEEGAAMPDLSHVGTRELVLWATEFLPSVQLRQPLGASYGFSVDGCYFVLSEDEGSLAVDLAWKEDAEAADCLITCGVEGLLRITRGQVMRDAANEAEAVQCSEPELLVRLDAALDVKEQEWADFLAFKLSSGDGEDDEDKEAEEGGEASDEEPKQTDAGDSAGESRDLGVQAESPVQEADTKAVDAQTDAKEADVAESQANVDATAVEQEDEAEEDARAAAEDGDEVKADDNCTRMLLVAAKYATSSAFRSPAVPVTVLFSLSDVPFSLFFAVSSASCSSELLRVDEADRDAEVRVSCTSEVLLRVLEGSTPIAQALISEEMVATPLLAFSAFLTAFTFTKSSFEAFFGTIDMADGEFTLQAPVVEAEAEAEVTSASREAVKFAKEEEEKAEHLKEAARAAKEQEEKEMKEERERAQKIQEIEAEARAERLAAVAKAEEDARKAEEAEKEAKKKADAEAKEAARLRDEELREMEVRRKAEAAQRKKEEEERALKEAEERAAAQKLAKEEAKLRQLDLWFDIRKDNPELVALVTTRIPQCFQGKGTSCTFMFSVEMAETRCSIVIDIDGATVNAGPMVASPKVPQCALRCTSAVLKSVLRGDTSLQVALMTGQILAQTGLDHLSVFTSAFDFSLPVPELDLSPVFDESAPPASWGSPPPLKKGAHVPHPEVKAERSPDLVVDGRSDISADEAAGADQGEAEMQEEVTKVAVENEEEEEEEEEEDEEEEEEEEGGVRRERADPRLNNAFHYLLYSWKGCTWSGDVLVSVNDAPIPNVVVSVTPADVELAPEAEGAEQYMCRMQLDSEVLIDLVTGVRDLYALRELSEQFFKCEEAAPGAAEKFCDAFDFSKVSYREWLIAQGQNPDDELLGSVGEEQRLEEALAYIPHCLHGQLPNVDTAAMHIVLGSEGSTLLNVMVDVAAAAKTKDRSGCVTILRGSPKADKGLLCTVELERPLFFAVVLGTVDASTALMEGRIVADDRAKALTFFQCFKFIPRHHSRFVRELRAQ